MGNTKISMAKRVLAFLLFIICSLTGPAYGKPMVPDEEKAKIQNVVEHIYQNRCSTIISGDAELIESDYDKNTRFGTWAYEYEIRRMKYLKKWEEKQGVTFIKIIPSVVIRRIRGGGDSYSLNLMLSTRYMYVYNDRPDEVNTSSVGTYHVLSIQSQEGNWVITKEWYKDPFGDYLSLGGEKAEKIKEYVLSQDVRDLSGINERRVKAVKYADTYCGAASGGLNCYRYNPHYRDFNAEGGDCANFASQILHEGGGFRKTGAWNYKKGEATRAWVNADGFNGYMTGSGRASVIAYGSYEKVYKASYKLLPGDYVAYEEKGDIVHISVVTGADSRGYSLVSCHNTDRSHVPWDLGWGGKNIRFYLVRVHF